MIKVDTPIKINSYTVKNRLTFAPTVKFDWTDEYDRFECMMGMPYQDFTKVSARQFFTETYLLDPAESVLKRYEAGMLGFRYIIKYIKAWVQYKIKRMQQERK